jgi:hypothetical protein
MILDAKKDTALLKLLYMKRLSLLGQSTATSEMYACYNMNLSRTSIYAIIYVIVNKFIFIRTCLWSKAA